MEPERVTGDLLGVSTYSLSHDASLYKLRNRIERCFNRLKQFRRLATRCCKRRMCFHAIVAGGTPAQIRGILGRIAEAIHDTSADVRVYMKEHPDFADIGERLLHEWEKGVALSLKV